MSARVCTVLSTEPDPLKRALAARDCTQQIAAEAQAAAAEGIRCDVKEMMPNKTYVLFTYERLLDVRIVYVPPRSLGNFGGDTDNFEWPRYPFRYHGRLFSRVAHFWVLFQAHC